MEWVLKTIDFLNNIFDIINFRRLDEKLEKRSDNASKSFYKVSSPREKRQLMCPNCGSVLKKTDSVCEMCGEKLNPESISEFFEQHCEQNPPIEIKRIEKYRCQKCEELIDTHQCPWCGNVKK